MGWGVDRAAAIIGSLVVGAMFPAATPTCGWEVIQSGIRRCSGVSTRNSPPNDHGAYPPSDDCGSWLTMITRRPASDSSAAAVGPASLAPTMITPADVGVGEGAGIRGALHPARRRRPLSFPSCEIPRPAGASGPPVPGVTDSAPRIDSCGPADSPPPVAS
jgi:hypothetical protein